MPNLHLGSSDGLRYTQGIRIFTPLPPPTIAPPPPPAPTIDYEQAKAEYGAVIPISMGTRRMPGQLIYASEVYGTAPNLYVDCLYSFGYNGDADPSATEITKLWWGRSLILDGTTKKLPGDWTYALYKGTPSQAADPMYAAAVGAVNASAFRGQLLASITKLPLKFTNYAHIGVSAEIKGQAGAAATFDEVKTTHASVTDGTTVTITNGADYSPAAVGLGHSTGKYYFEIEWLDVAAQGRQSIGLVTGPFNPSVDYLTEPASAANTVGIQNANSVWAGADGTTYPAYGQYTSNPTLGQQTTWTTGTRTGIAVDLDAGLIWWRHNGYWSGYFVDWATNPNPTWVEGNPATGLHGFPYASYEPPMLGAVLYAAIQMDGLGNSARGHFDLASFASSAPSGFSAWGGTAGGSAATSTLRAVIERVAQYAGLNPATDLAFDATIADAVTGALLTEPTTFGEFAQKLGRAYGFDMVEADTISFVEPVNGTSYAVDSTVPAADLLNEGDRAITTTRREDDAPIELALSYIDQSQQFRYNTQRARRILFPVRSTQSRRKDAFGIPVIIPASTALSLAARTMFREADQNVVHTFTLPSKYLFVEVGDILNVTAGDTSYDVKVTKVAIETDLSVRIDAVNLFAAEDLALVGSSGVPLLPYTGTIPTAIANGYLSATEGADTFAATGGATVTGTMSAVDGADAFAASGGVTVTGTVAAIEGADAFSASGTVGETGATGTMAATDGADTLNASGTVTVTGTMAAVEGADTFAASADNTRVTTTADTRVTTSGDIRITA